MTTRTGAVPTWTLADRLRKAREYAGLEQSELAERAGIARQSVSNYEGGRRTPRKPVLWAWADVCGVDRDWLIGDDGDGPNEAPPVGLEPTTYRSTARRPRGGRVEVSTELDRFRRRVELPDGVLAASMR